MKIIELTPEEILGVLNEVERKNAPRHLYLAGDTSLLRQGPRLSVVGSRRASEDGLKRTRSLVRALVQRNMIVVSGLAEGVDTAAHETALAEGGRTIAVIGTPLDGCFPTRNRSLQERIVREGLVVSQFPLGAPIEKKNFPIRNRTMALLTDATVIVEAGESSGTLHQGWEALRLGRLLFLMQSVVEDTTLSWPAEMIRYGAQVLSRDNLDLILDEMPSFAQVEPVAL